MHVSRDSVIHDVKVSIRLAMRLDDQQTKDLPEIVVHIYAGTEYFVKGCMSKWASPAKMRLEDAFFAGLK